MDNACTPPRELEPSAAAGRGALFDGPFFASARLDPRLPAINTVFVQSADGNTGARNPADLGGGATDTHLIYEGLSRVRADAVMTGATTIRGSQMIFGVWHPELVRLREDFGLPRYPAQIVATRSGTLGIESELMFNVPEVPVFILTTAGCRRRGGAADRGTPVDHHPRRDRKTRISPTASSRLRADHGIRRISCIGGRTLATELIDAGARPGHLPDDVTKVRRRARDAVLHRSSAARTSCVVKKAGRGEEDRRRLRASADRPKTSAVRHGGRLLPSTTKVVVPPVDPARLDGGTTEVRSRIVGREDAIHKAVSTSGSAHAIAINDAARNAVDREIDDGSSCRISDDLTGIGHYLTPWITTHHDAKRQCVRRVGSDGVESVDAASVVSVTIAGKPADHKAGKAVYASVLHIVVFDCATRSSADDQVDVRIVPEIVVMNISAKALI